MPCRQNVDENLHSKMDEILVVNVLDFFVKFHKNDFLKILNFQEEAEITFFTQKRIIQ